MDDLVVECGVHNRPKTGADLQCRSVGALLRANRAKIGAAEVQAVSLVESTEIAL